MATPNHHLTPNRGVAVAGHVSRDATNRRQMVVLFVWFLAGWTYAGGLLPLLPVHARELGASPTIAGAYLAIAYLAMMAGSISALWLNRRHAVVRRWTIIGSWLCAGGAAIMIVANRVWLLTVATSLVWGSFGLINPMGNTLLSASSPQSRHGRAFGLVGMSQGLGSIIGGMSLGPAAEQWGYPGMLTLGCGLIVFMALSATFLQDVRPPRSSPDSLADSAPSKLGAPFIRLLAAVCLMTVAGYLAIMGRSLLMDDAGFGPSAISGAAAIAGAVVLIGQPLAGWLADRCGRRAVLVGNVVLLATCMFMFSLARSLWLFWLASALYGLSASRQGPMRALVGELLPPDASSTGMALLTVSFGAGGAMGFALAGRAYELLGGAGALRWGTMLPLATVVILWSIGATDTGAETRSAH